jgi:hypothetical protein
MEKEVIIKPNYTTKECFEFTFKNLIAKWSVKFIISYALLLVIVDLGHLFQISDVIIFPNGIPIFNIVFPILVFIVFPIFIYLLAKKALHNDHKLGDQTLFIFNKDYFRIKKELSDVKKPWNFYESIVETEDNFLLKQNKNKMDFFPKRFFSEQQIIDFRELMKALDINKSLKN